MFYYNTSIKCFKCNLLYQSLQKSLICSASFSLQHLQEVMNDAILWWTDSGRKKTVEVMWWRMLNWQRMNILQKSH